MPSSPPAFLRHSQDGTRNYGYYISHGWRRQHAHSRQTRPTQATLSHELIAGAASFAVCHESLRRSPREEWQAASHALAKELLAGFSGAFIDRMVETKGLDAIDKAKAKHHAKEHHDQHFQY
ncbi:hypothetical protein BU15DRAFT_74138 [Melanogaster broomeanus]|nr:hypothetical protein BU15DRAFT_74138 [Melanogaster broomeanus]